MKWNNISKQYVVFRNTKNFHVDKDYLIEFVFTGFVFIAVIRDFGKEREIPESNK